MQNNFPVVQNKNAVPLLEKDLTDKIIGAAIESIEYSVLDCWSYHIKYAWSMKTHCDNYSLADKLNYR